MFILPIAALSAVALTLSAGPPDMLATVSRGLHLTHVVPKKSRPCQPRHQRCPSPRPTHPAPGSVTPTASASPTTPGAPASTPTATPTITPTPAPTGTAPAPASGLAQVCGNGALLAGPSSPPAGAITVPAGNNAAVFDYQLPDNTTYYFAAGTHYLGSGTYAQISPGRNDTFIGAPGAVISGDNPGASGYTQNAFAFVGNETGVTGVTIEYLTIENFAPPGSQGAVNTNSNDNWTVAHNTIRDNVPGAAMMVGSNNTIKSNCLTGNGQYAFNAYQNPGDPQASKVTGGPQNIVVADNEIASNGTCNWEKFGNFPIKTPAGCAGAGQFDGCGCSGGGKFWQDQNVTVQGNYVHDNYSAGIWADTNNDGFSIQGNYFSANYAEALIYEISYNALIKGNTFTGNAWGTGASDSGFPDSAVYISESGGDSRVANSFGYSTLDIVGNTFTDNWGGVILWENANRFCSDGYDDACTLVAPATATEASCKSGLGDPAKNQPGATPDYFDLCRWKTQNVTVSGNAFTLNPAHIGSACTAARGCGFNGVFSQYGSAKPYTAWVVPVNISSHQANVFKGNTYAGPWSFDGLALGDTVTWAQWTGGFKDDNGSNATFGGQDAGSTYN
jgi:parallel beta helix pectate lyase-like protein